MKKNFKFNTAYQQVRKRRSKQRRTNPIVRNVPGQVGEKKWGYKLLVIPNFTINYSDFCWTLQGKSGSDDSFAVTLNEDDGHYFFEVDYNNDKSCTDDTSRRGLRRAIKELLMKEFER